LIGLGITSYMQEYDAGKLPIYPVGWAEDIHDPHNWVMPYTLGVLGSVQGLPQGLRTHFEDLINQGVEAIDQNQRAAVYHKYNQLFYDQLPTILLYVQNGRHYEQDWVNGYYHNPMMSGDYYYALSKE